MQVDLLVLADFGRFEVTTIARYGKPIALDDPVECGSAVIDLGIGGAIVFFVRRGDAADRYLFFPDREALR